ncbi:hypothetical protein Ddc_17232 [Ditylenchus destructor]|nr:hypothetical protein Ddc_17232 [Ditylenchus destructor]
MIPSSREDDWYQTLRRIMIFSGVRTHRKSRIPILTRDLTSHASFRLGRSWRRWIALGMGFLENQVRLTGNASRSPEGLWLHLGITLRLGRVRCRWIALGLGFQENQSFMPSKANRTE